MKLLHCGVKNFGSYKELCFNFSEQGLSLISGATGSGKSTLQNIPLWILFGKTMKDVNVDEVKKWDGDGETLGWIEVELKDAVIEIHRVRGKKPSDNDLFWLELGRDAIHPVRGKDIADTQRLLNVRMGVDDELFTNCATFCEFSPTNTFFTDAAKSRRELFEKIVDLDLPVKLAARVVEDRKKLKREYDLLSMKQSQIFGRLEGLKDAHRKAEIDAKKWKIKHQENIDLIEIKKENYNTEIASTLAAYTTKSEAFERQKSEKIAELTGKINLLSEKIMKMDLKRCPTCGHTKDPIDQATEQNNSMIMQLDNIKNSSNVWADKINELNKVKIHKNPYEEQLESENKKSNPTIHLLYEFKKDIQVGEDELEVNATSMRGTDQKISVLNQLYDLSMELRGALLKSSIKSIETQMNDRLDGYFDSTIRVELTLANLDSLDVKISKEGNQCSFKQLSKGQRNMLKLVFALSIMEHASAKAGIRFGTLLLDEPTDGLDDTLKRKAYKLFEDLLKRHDSVLIIEHFQELKVMFSKVFEVELTEKGSIIHEA